MSIENHLNINAAGFASDIVSSFYEHLRGRAKLNSANIEDAGEIVHDLIVDFVTEISERLDGSFGE